MNPFSRRDWKKVAWKQIDNPKPQVDGWTIGGIIIILAILKVIFFP